jgi:hypothetical protein
MGTDITLTEQTILDVAHFNDEVVGGYNMGTAEKALPADLDTARSLVPAGTGAFRDFSYLAPDIPEFVTEKCVGCMECVTDGFSPFREPRKAR